MREDSISSIHGENAPGIWQVTWNSAMFRENPKLLINTQQLLQGTSSGRMTNTFPWTHRLPPCQVMEVAKFGRQSKKVLQFEQALRYDHRDLSLMTWDICGTVIFSTTASWVAFYKRDPFLVFNNLFINTNYWMYWDYSANTRPPCSIPTGIWNSRINGI